MRLLGLLRVGAVCCVWVLREAELGVWVRVDSGRIPARPDEPDQRWGAPFKVGTSA